MRPTTPSEDAVRLFREPDGMAVDPDSVAVAVIKEDADCPGVRVTFLDTLQNAHVSMQADLGFSDVVTPGP